MLWSIKINSKLDYCLLICYPLVRTLLAAADGNGCHFGHHCHRWTSQIREHAEVDRNYLITTLIYWFYQNPSTAASERTWARPPATRTVWIHWIHAAGGANGSITMVVVFVGCLCYCGWTRDVTSSSYVKNGTKITLRLGPRHNILAHPHVHHTSGYVRICTIILWRPHYSSFTSYTPPPCNYRSHGIAPSSRHLYPRHSLPLPH